MTPTERLQQADARVARAREAHRDTTIELEAAVAERGAILRHTEDADAAQPAALTERIVQLLGNGQDWTPAQIVAALSIADPTVESGSVRATLSQLVQTQR
jgi:hypothetical protein